MNRTDRLLAILLELQGKGQLRAEDLAATFETSKRTIYRDIQALCESGVPVISAPGQGYSLVEGFFLPPVTFTTDEATMILLGTNLMAQNFDAQYRLAAESAGRKIEAVLNPKRRDEVHYLQKSITFVASDAADTETLRKLRQAILERKTIRFVYHTRYPESHNRPPALREADPCGLVHFSGAWYLSAYCHTRHDLRNFRLDRVEALQLLPQTFARLARPASSGNQVERGRDLTIRVLFEPGIARWVRESRFYFVVAEEETPQGLLLTLQVRQELEAMQWLLSWGGKAQVLEPEFLRQKIAKEAAEVIKAIRVDSRLLKSLLT